MLILLRAIIDDSLGAREALYLRVPRVLVRLQNMHVQDEEKEPKITQLPEVDDGDGGIVGDQSKSEGFGDEKIEEGALSFCEP